MTVKQSVIAAVCALAFAIGLDTTAKANLFVNGDFQSGSLAPSTTAYSYSTSMGDPATWEMVSFDTVHPDWLDFYDHTMGNSNGFYLAINGAYANIGPAWAQQVSVSPNTDYQLSGWFANVLQRFATGPVSLQFRVMNGSDKIAEAAFQTSATPGIWTQSSMSFNSGSATSLSVQIWDPNSIWIGEDYAIDDLSVAAIPEPSTVSLFVTSGIVLLGLLYQRRRKS